MPDIRFIPIVAGTGEPDEVVEPKMVRKQMRNFAKNLMSYYKEEKE